MLIKSRNISERIFHGKSIERHIKDVRNSISSRLRNPSSKNNVIY